MKWIYKNENILNLPNILSFYRLIASALEIAFILMGYEKLFVIFISISLITDLLDGFIARKFNLYTKFGASLDNLADLATYIAALWGLFVFKWTELSSHIWILYIFFFVFLISYLISFWKFRRVPGLHLYGGVITGYLQGIFFIVLFLIGFYPWFFYIAMGLGILAYVEKSIVLIILDDIKPGLKGYYWLIKESRQ